jgi:hypothetical protein
VSDLTKREHHSVIAEATKWSGASALEIQAEAAFESQRHFPILTRSRRSNGLQQKYNSCMSKRKNTYPL